MVMRAYVHDAVDYCGRGTDLLVFGGEVAPEQVAGLCVEGVELAVISCSWLRIATRGAMRGEAAISKHMAAKVFKEFTRLAEIKAGNIAGQLTPREKQVLQKLSAGLGNKEIAHSLFISENTVKVYVTSILKKLHLQSRSQAAACAQRLGLYETED